MPLATLSQLKSTIMARKKRSGSGGGDGTTTPRSTSKKKRDQHANDDAVNTSSQKKTKRAKMPSREAHRLPPTNDQVGDEALLAGHNMGIDEECDVMGQVPSGRGGGGQSKSSNIYGDAYARLLAGSSEDSSSSCDKEEKEERLRSTVAGLVDYLSSAADEANDAKVEGRSSVSSSRLSKVDIVKLLLPWAVKSVLRRASSSSSVLSSNDAEGALEWRTLSSCLDILMPATASNASSIDASIQSTVLNQSNLNKLVPLAAKIAMSDSVVDECESALLEQATSAASCFRALALVYRPTMDAACNDLLILVDGLSSMLQGKNYRGDDGNERVEDDEMNASFRFDFQAKVIESTVSLIWRLQQSGAANPKKIFALLSSSSTLSALGRFYAISGSSSIQDLVKNILWRGLFRASHHIEGFRSMKLDVGSLIDTKAQGALDDKKKRKVACYQESLLNSIREAILDVNTGAVGVGVAAIVPLLVEGFVHETRKWLANRERDTRSGGIAGGGGGAGRPSAKANVTALQFKFWCILLEPAIAQVKRYNEEESRSSNGVQRAILRCIQMSLSVLLKYDLYLPSYPNPDQRNVGYLRVISSCLLRFAESSLADDGGALSFSSQQEMCEILLSLRALLDSNHHILHNDLHRLVLLAAKCLPDILDENDSSDTDTPRHQQLGVDLVCASITTYASLRQLEHLFSALLLQKSAQSESSEALPLLERIIQDTRIVSEVSKAILSSPQGQVRPIWSLFDESVSKIMKNTVDDESGEANGLRYVIGAFILFIRSIRIDQYSAGEIKMLCERSVDTSIPALVSDSVGGESEENELDPFDLAEMSSNAVHGVSLCGWLIDAHTRCSFWLDLNFDEVAGSSLLSGGSRQSMLKLLLHAANSQKATGDKNLFRNHSLQTSLQHLACHRIEQLHSMIHQKEQIENVASQLGEDDGSKGSADLIAEARLLVDFAVRTADSCGREVMRNECSSTVSRKGGDWAVLDQTLSLWAPYSESRHIDCFLSWVLSSLVLSDDNTSTKSRIDRDIAKALVADASFYENREISSQLLGVTITAAITATQKFMNSNSGSGDTTRKSARKSMKRKRSKSVDSGSASRAEALLCVPSDPSFQALTTQSLTEAYHESVDEDSAVRSISPDSFAEGGDLGRVLRLLRFANSLPADLIARTCKPLHVDLLLRLDAYVQGLLHSSTGLNAELLQQLSSLSSACKLALERTIVAANFTMQADSTGPLCSVESQKAILQATQRSYVVAGKSHNHSFAKYSLHAGRVIELLLSGALHTHRSGSSLLEGFAEATDAIASQGNSSIEADSEFIANILFLRSITRGLIIIDSNVLRSRNPANGRRACDLFFPLAFFEGGFWKMLVDFIADYDAEKQGQTKLSAVSEAILLVSDLIRYASSLPSTAYVPIEPLLLKALERVFRSTFERSFHSNIDGSTTGPLRSSLYYLVASAPGLCCKLASLDAPMLSLEMIQNHFKISSGNPYPDSLLDSAFCGIVQHSDIEQTRSLLAALVNGLQSTAWDTRSLYIASSVHAYHLILLSTKGQQQKAEVSSVARYFSSVSQQLLHSGAPDKEEGSVLNERCAQIGTSFLATLIGKKDVLLFSSQDAATLLSRVINLLPPVPKTTQRGTKDGKFLVSCNIYRECCAVVSALIKFYPKQLYGCAPSVISVFHSLLSQATEATGDNVVLMALEFGKLAELLTTHNEVFKKHVLGLILFFVDSLVAGMSAVTKKTLLPAIFSLLGMLSKYELHQLQVTMTPSSKSLFRSIFRDFQKMQYKGQY